MKVKEWIKVLNKLDPEETICVHYCQIGDVLHMAEEMDEEVTNDEAQEILEEIEDNIDSEITTKFILLIILFLTKNECIYSQY